MAILIYLLIILAVGLIIWALSLSQQSRASRLPPSNMPVKSSKPHLLLSRLLPTQGLLKGTGLYAKIKKKIDAGHLNISPEGFFNLKILLMLILAALTPVALGKSEPLYILIALAIGYLAPDFYLKQKDN